MAKQGRDINTVKTNKKYVIGKEKKSKIPKKYKKLITVISLVLVAFLTFMLMKQTSFGLKNTYTGQIEEIKEDYILLKDMRTLDIHETSNVMKQQDYMRLDIKGNKEVNKKIKSKEFKKGVEIKFKTTDKIKVTEDYPPKILSESINYIKKK